MGKKYGRGEHPAALGKFTGFRRISYSALQNIWPSARFSFQELQRTGKFPLNYPN